MLLPYWLGENHIMKTCRYVKLNYLLILLVFLLSCKKDHRSDSPKPAVDPAGSVDPNRQLITRYEYAPNLYSLFSYNNAGQITGITDINDIVQTDYTVTYQPGGKVNKIASKYGYWKLTYQNGQLDRADSYTNGSSAAAAYFKFIWDGQNVKQVLTYTNYDTGALQPRSKIDCFYNTNGDITRSDTYIWNTSIGDYQLAEHVFYESDTHTNPVYWFRDIFMVLYRITGQHNFTRVESFYADGSIDQDDTYDFQYNDHGYPISAIRKNLAAGTNGFVTLKFLYR